MRTTVRAVVLGVRWVIGCLVCNLRGVAPAAARVVVVAHVATCGFGERELVGPSARGACLGRVLRRACRIGRVRGDTGVTP
jgi:hypothetical protein